MRKVKEKKGKIALLSMFLALLFIPITVSAAIDRQVNDHQVSIGPTTYDTLEEAVSAAKPNDTIQLGEGHYSLYKTKYDGKDINTFTKEKNLTFVGKGTDKTFWGIGADVPAPDKFGTEYNGDYSFDGADTITFKNMTLQSSTADYLGFIRAKNTVVEGCVVNGKTFYWGYETATFNNTVFNPPQGDYAFWTYSSPVMTLENCTFNSSGKTINVYSDYNADKTDITLNINNCTVNSIDGTAKPVLNINDSNKVKTKFLINFTGTNTIDGLVHRDTAKPSNKDHTATCSRWFGFGGKQDTNNTGRTIVTIDGTEVFRDGHMVVHEIDTTYDKYTDGYKDNAYDLTDWTLNEEAKQFTRVKICQYCEEKVNETGYQLRYDPAGGMWQNEDTEIKQVLTPLKTEQKIIAGPTRKGYTFVGWKVKGMEDKLYQADELYNITNEKEEFINSELTATWEPALNTVTFINNGSSYAEIKVQNTMSINNDILTDQTMPESPSKTGYTFKEWNTQEDGKGLTFTGDTEVNEDITVYAIYNLNDTVILEVKDMTITVGDELDLKTLITKAEDKEDGTNLNDIVLIEDGDFDNTKPGQYKITFTLTDSEGAKITKTATVTVSAKETTTTTTKEPTKPSTVPSQAQKPTTKPTDKVTQTGESAVPYILSIVLLGAAVVTVVIRKKAKEN